MSHILNPHASESGFTTDAPASLPPLPFTKPVSDLGKAAKRLHAAATDATARLHEVRGQQSDAIARFRAAQAALQAEVIRGGREGADAEREQKLSLELSAAERLANPETHQLRYRSSVAEQRARVRELKVFLWDHVIDLLEAEIRPEAESASEALVKALATIDPVRQRYLAIQRAAVDLLSITAAGEYGPHFAQSLRVPCEPLPPLPSEEAIAEFERARTPEVLRDLATEAELDNEAPELALIGSDVTDVDD